MKTETRVLIVDDEPDTLHVLADGLQDRGFECSTARGGQEAITRLEECEGNVDVLVTDVSMPGMNGLDLTQTVTERWSEVDVIIMTSYSTTKHALIGGRNGAAEFLAKPVLPEHLDKVIRNVRAEKAVQRPLGSRRHRGPAGKPSAGETLLVEDQLSMIVGRHRSMQELRRRIKRLADLQETVLVDGESGTGKELVARALHEAGSRKSEPFLALNCGAIPASLLESELFGYVRGAFSGADGNKDGYFVGARGGTLLLDEIGEMPYDLQVKLLRALQERVVTPLGTTKIVPWSARVVCATNLDLAKQVSAGKFRQDLFYRINVLSLQVPPLRERRSDVPILARYFLDQAPIEHSGLEFSEDALAALQAYDWPGNVRQLQSFIVGAAANSSGQRILVGDFPKDLQPSDPLEGFPTHASILRELIIRALREARGVRTRAADLLDVDRNRLKRWIDKYEIRPGEYGKDVE